ncbi:peptidoglycan DD-metalloendopeptidase family protein [Candidatus Azambacteria bacterium]|nr:peptidoglycan DD-metalloendopeptidase family protein [Candidatus Azambacteria bacterium]
MKFSIFNLQFSILVLIWSLVLGGWNFPARAGLIDDLQKEITTKEAEIKRLEVEAAALKSSIQQKQGEANSLKQQIAAIDQRITKLSTDIRLTQARIRQTTLSIQALEVHIGEKERSILARKSQIASTIRAVNILEDEGVLEQVLKYDTLADFLNARASLDQLEAELANDLATLRDIKAALEEDRKAQEEKRGALEEFQEDLEAKRGIERDQRGERDVILKETKNQEAKYQALLKDVQKKQQEIQLEIVDLENKLRLAIDPKSVPKGGKGIVGYPSEGLLTQGYGPTSQTGFINDAYKFHNGIDIAAGFGAPIRAARDGTVAGAGDNGRYAYGRWVAIQHDNGLTTLYAHLSRAIVSRGSQVKRGQVIGYEGSTGFSTGSHLHFTVYLTISLRFENRWFGLPILLFGEGSWG